MDERPTESRDNYLDWFSLEALSFGMNYLKFLLISAA